MSFLPLVITDDTRALMREVIARAEAEPVTLDEVIKLKERELLPESVNHGKTFNIPAGFHVVYTHEQQPNGVVRHLSMSITLPGRVPHLEAVRIVMKEMGFVLPLEECVFWEEPCGSGKVAINVVEPLDGGWAPHHKTEGDA